VSPLVARADSADAGRIPPHSKEAEELLLGAVLSAGAIGADASRSLFANLVGEIAEGDFYLGHHRRIFLAARALVEEGKPCDALLVTAELERRGDLKHVEGGRGRLAEIAVLAPATGNAPQYAAEVRRKAEQRALLQELTPVYEAAWNGFDANATRDRLRRSIELLETRPSEAAWLERASDLLGEPDPGPTPFLIDELIVDQAVAMILGSWKVGKTWALLELAVSIVTGRPALGRLEVAQPGPVIVVLEESGRAAFHRRLDALRRGYAIDREALADLHFAANRRVRLNEDAWKTRLLAAGRALRPRAVLLDPLVRLKGADVDENVQREMGPVLDFMRELRDETGAAVFFVHHTGHNGTHGRGSSDLEGYWESKVTITCDDDGVRTLKAEHREAEAASELRYRLAFDLESRSMRLAPVEDPLRVKVATYLDEHPDASANDVCEVTKAQREKVLKLVKEIREGGSQAPEPLGTTLGGPSLAGGSEEGGTPRRGAPPGTAADGLVPAAGNLTLQDEAERLAEKHGDIAGAGAA